MTTTHTPSRDYMNYWTKLFQSTNAALTGHMLNLVAVAWHAFHHGGGMGALGTAFVAVSWGSSWWMDFTATQDHPPEPVALFACLIGTTASWVLLIVLLFLGA